MSSYFLIFIAAIKLADLWTEKMPKSTVWVFPVHFFPAHLAVSSDLVFLLLHVAATNIVTFCQPELL